MLSEFWKQIQDFFATGTVLNQDLPNAIRNATENETEGESVEQITSQVRKHFKVASKIANWLTFFICTPLLFFVLYQVLGRPLKIVVIGYLFLVGGLSVLAVVLLGSLVGTARAIHELPDAIYRELTGPLWRNLDILFIAVSIDLFAYIFPAWNISTAYPILILVALLWLFAPWAIYVAKADTVFIKLRIAQLGVVVLSALVCAASPIPMRHFQWGAERKIIETMRPFEETEITSRWKTLEWFTQEGAPNVWYSNIPDGGYRLFSTPGTDKQTGEQLKPVTDKETKERIVKEFQNEETARVTSIQTENRERFVREYVCVGIGKNLGHRTALVVLNGEEQESSKLADRLSKSLGAVGVNAEKAVFTSAFTKSPLFEDMLGGRFSTDRSFKAEDYASHLLVVEVSEKFGSNRPDGTTEMRTDDLVWVIKLIAPADGRVMFTNEIHTHGIGFKDTDAQQLATERAENQLKTLASSIVPLL
jgi:hypothetical protein